jgi:hypothetical protein
VSEAAAKMRVGRALEKLRTFFSSCGIACSVAGLLALLDQNAAASVPPSVTASILSQVGKLKAAAKIPATVASAPKIGLQMAGAILVVGMAVIFLGPKLMRSNRASTQQSNPAVTPLATGTASASLLPAPDVGAQAASATGLRLKVLDGETARPLSGVRVSASELHQKFGEWVTDENGKCELTRPPPKAGDFYFSLRARHDEFATMEVSWSRFQHDEPSDIPAEYVLKMPSGIRVGGSVIDDEGRPLVGTQVRLFGHDASPGPPPRERAILNDGAEGFVTTDAGGLWTFDRLPHEWDNVHFIVSAAGFLPADFVSDANDQGGIGQAKIRKEEFLELRAVLRLRRGTYLLGHVLDENRQPIAGARVVQNFKWREAHALVTTGKDGAYEFFNAPTGSLTLSFQVAHYAPQTTNLTVDGPSTNAPVILAPGHVLRGRVIDTDGSGVADAEVGVDAIAPGRMEFQWSTKTDIDGRFTWDGAPVDPASYAIYKPGFHGTQVVLAANGSEQTVTVERIGGAAEQIGDDAGVRVQGRVLDNESGQPIEKFRVFVGGVREIFFGAGREGTNGSFSIRLWNDAKPVVIEIHADGYMPERIENISNTGGDKSLEFRLRASTGWNGQVLLPNGEPAVGAEVALSRMDRPPILGERRLLFKEQCINRVADASGSFHFDPVHDAKLIVAVHQQGYAERDVDQLARAPIIRLQSWGRIEGVLRSAGGTLPNKRVCVRKRFWNPWTLSIDLYSEPCSVTTDDNGRFVFESVPPGDHALSHSVVGRVFEVLATIQVRPGETTAMEVGGNGRTLLGQIVVPGREPGFDFSHSGGELDRRQARPIDLPRTVRRRDFSSDEAFQQAERDEGVKLTAYWQSGDGLNAWREHRTYAVWFDADGALHADDVPAGNYELKVILRGPDQQIGVNFVPGRVVGFYSASITVPEKNDDDESEAANLGTVTLDSKYK